METRDISHDDKTEVSPVALVVTIFSRLSSTSSTPVSKTDVSSLRAPLSTILSSLIPTISTHSTHLLTPTVLQIHYIAPSCPFTPHTLRHNPSTLIFASKNSIELVFDILPPFTTPSRPLRLAIFDMDSTLIDQEVIDELARSKNLTSAVSAITARAMDGEIDFAASLKERVALLEGVKADVWEDLKGVITIAKGAREVCRGLRERGVKTAVISGGFQPMADWLMGELGLDYAFANHILISSPTPLHPYPHLSGTLSPRHPIITPTLKRSLLLSLADRLQIPISQTLAVGDGANDLLMLESAGLGVAWNAKRMVQERAPNRLNGGASGLGEVGLLVGVGWDEERREEDAI